MVKEILDQAVEGDYVFEGILPSPLDTGYRNKMEYTFGDEVKDGPLTLGLHKRGSFYDIVSVGQCRLVHPDYGKFWKRLWIISGRQEPDFIKSWRIPDT